uniref:Putative ovule protein n=1 Tax=Solanum chacoense TaxID=4108 RepID=A0A0V0HM90_SOLCH
MPSSTSVLETPFLLSVTCPAVSPLSTHYFANILSNWCNFLIARTFLQLFFRQFLKTWNSLIERLTAYVANYTKFLQFQTLKQSSPQLLYDIQISNIFLVFPSPPL